MVTTNAVNLTQRGVAMYDGAGHWTQGAYPSCQNLGIAYNGGTGVFTVQGSDGTALSATNPAYVTLASKTTPGNLVTILVTANQSFIDDAGASEIIGNLFGYTTGVAIAVDVPFYIYAVLNDAETSIQFMLSRCPHYQVSPAAASIGFPGTPGANSQTAFFSFDTITTSQWDANPVLCIGSFKMRMSASDDWTVQTLLNIDGIGRFNEFTQFTIPLGQFGADAGTYTIPNGGTSAVFTSSTGQYYLKKNGMVVLHISLTGDAGTDGAGAVEARIETPLVPIQNTLTIVQTIIAAATVTFARATVVSSTNYVTWGLIGAVNTTWAAYGNGNRTWNIGVSYPAL